MQKKRWSTAGALAVLLTTTTFADDKSYPIQPAANTNTVAVKAQTLCPVMKGPIDKTQFVDYDGKRIYVCCGGCLAKIKKDPAKYVKQLEAEGITLDKAAPHQGK